MHRTYKYTLGIRVNNTNLPDPSKMTFQVGDLDTSGSRDATGLLHRARVATKINYEMTWSALEYEMLVHVLGAITGDKFTLTAPDPRTLTTTYTGQYYVGDRKMDVIYYLPERGDIMESSLTLKFIEY